MIDWALVFSVLAAAVGVVGLLLTLTVREGLSGLEKRHQEMRGKIAKWEKEYEESTRSWGG